jgi:hypothetical protein
MHLSMRVPWMDRPWDGAVCDSPHANASCVLLRNIGPRRDDAFESASAGITFDQLDPSRLPCLSERASWLSSTGYQVTKTHPYAWNQAVSAAPTAISVPGWGFEAIPYRWLSRETLANSVGYDRTPRFSPDAEDAADRAMGLAHPVGWVMDGGNQRALIEEFFAPVAAKHSLVFTYLKHSPLQESRSDRLIVGAAHVTSVTMPPMWNTGGPAAFGSSMWETVVTHSLRPKTQESGILLPYQQLAALADDGRDISAALAWAPEGRDVAFSYVTEHLTDDAALEALASLQRAAAALPAFGLSVPDAALSWLEAQAVRLWKLRGPTPGLAAVLAHLGVEHAHAAAHELIAAASGTNPWGLAEAGFADATALPISVRPFISHTTARVWASRSETERDALRMLSGMDVDATQVAVVLDGRTDVPVDLGQLVTNPYFAATCTYGQPEHISFSTVDRACFPGEGADWEPLVATIADITEHQDARRVEALLTEVLETAGRDGDTLLSQEEAVQAAARYPLVRPPQLTVWTLESLRLASTELRGEDAWPIVGVDLADGTPGLKLARFEYTSQVIRNKINELRTRPHLGALPNARAFIDAILHAQSPTSGSDGSLDEAEERARTEKAAGLAELFASPLSVLIGPAGTGKTTLLRALVKQLPGKRVILLAPTGKARVQLESKVGVRAATLASFLVATGRYDGRHYLVGDEHSVRIDADLVVIDEASMLTEEMLAATLDAFRRIGRLVFVGDPRQLPPIGAGRPFVDLVGELRPDTFTGLERVGPCYVELRVPRRQIGTRTPPKAGAAALGVSASASASASAGATVSEAGRRADLELAAWFGEGDLGIDADRVWEQLATEPDQGTVRYESWNGRTPAEVLTEALTAELNLTAIHGVRNVDGLEAAFALTYGATLDGEYLNWDLGAGRRSEDWQILSPTRSRASGTTEINRQLKRAYRTGELATSLRTLRNTNLPAPLGPEQITRGDKVMATRNDPKIKASPTDSGLDYVANGEIGVAIGRFRAGKKKGLTLNVEYSSQPGARYSYWTSNQEDPKLELAWAVTVHKSQGSEFGLTLLLLPARAAVSRELMYTALTRQRDRIVILHEGTLDDLREMSQPWRSETARRLTDLFAPPRPVSIDPPGGGALQRVDGRIMHVTAGGIAVKSKNEVIVASILDELAPSRWAYETPLKGNDGRTLSPDFTIQRADGSRLLWEHLGLMDDLDYARKWALKQKWYIDNGFLPHPQCGEAGTLMWTDDRSGVDVPAWRALANEAIGQLATLPVRRGPGARRSPASS